jgi:hypothetical protein
MNMDQAAVFLAGSILTMLGFIVVFGGIILINNLLSMYWKPVKLFRYDTPPARFISDEEMAILHEMDKKKAKHE